MIMVNTNKPRNSKTTIEAVMHLRDTNKDKFDYLMQHIGDITERLIWLF